MNWGSFIPVASTLGRYILRPLSVGTVIIHHIFVPDVLELANLVGIQVLVGPFVPPLVAVLASVDVATDFARVHTEALERRNEGRCVPVEWYFATVSGPCAPVPQTCVDAHSLAVGEGDSQVFVVLEDPNGGRVHVESEDRKGLRFDGYVIMLSSKSKRTWDELMWRCRLET